MNRLAARAPRARAPLTPLVGALLWLLMVVAPMALAAPIAYIANYGSNDVSVLDTATGTVTATVPVGRNPYGVSVNSAGTRVYVSNSDQDSVSVLDTATNSVIASIPVGDLPLGVATNAAGTRLYVANTLDGSVSVIDTATNTVITTIEVGSSPHGAAVSLTGARVYITNESSNSVSVIDTTSNTVVATVPVAPSPRGVAVNAAGTRVYVAHYNFGAGTVSVIDTQTNAVVASPEVSGSSIGLAINPAGNLIYVTNNRAPRAVVSVIDTRCNALITNVELPANTAGIRPFATGIAVNPAGTRVYVTTFSQTGGGAIDNSVQVIDTATNTVIDAFTVGNSPESLGVFISPGAVEPPPPPIPPTPIRVTGIEVTQGIQDLANHVSAVNGRRTFARVHVKSDGPAFPGVTASLTGLGVYVDAANTPVFLPLGTLVPSNAGGPRITVNPEPKRTILDDSFLFEIPWGWTNFEYFRVHATLSEPGGNALASCAGDVLAGPAVDVDDPVRMNVAFVRMGYKLPGSFPNPADAYAQTSLFDRNFSVSWIRRTYPVTNFEPAPDVALVDYGLGSWVDRSDPGCVDAFEPDEREFCAYSYTSSRLASLYVSSGLFRFRPDELVDQIDTVYGLIPPHPSDPIGLFTRGACCVSGVGAGPANDVDYAAHEIGHFLGRHHPLEASGPDACGHVAADPNYPYFYTFIAPPLADPNTAMAGFDSGDASLGIAASVRPAVISPRSGSFDIMGYCQPFSWISDYTHRNLYISLRMLHSRNGQVESRFPRALSKAQQAGDWLLVFGHVAPDLASATIIDIQRVDRIFAQPTRVAGNYSIRLLGEGGAMLADYPFAPEVADDALPSGGMGGTQLGFGHAVPFVAGTTQVQIVASAAGGAVIASRPVSSNPPQIGNVALQGDPDPASGFVTLAWTASDADRDLLRFDVLSARNDAETLQPLILGVSGASTQIDTSLLGGGVVNLRVVARDGLLTAFADSAPITLSNKPPKLRVISPGDGAHYYRGQVVNLDGEAMDLQDGAIAGGNLAWSSRQGAIGTGARVSISGLPVGVNPITLSATNSLGLTATSTVNILVDGNLGPSGPMLTAGPMQIGWQVPAGEVQLQSAPLDVGNRGSGDLQFTASSSASWLTLNATTGSAPTTLTLSANPAGLAEGVSVDASVTLAAVGIPDQVIVVPVRLAVGNTFEVGNAMPPVVVDFIVRNDFEGP